MWQFKFDSVFGNAYTVIKKYYESTDIHMYVSNGWDITSFKR